MTDRTDDGDELVDFERLLTASVDAALRTQQWAGFLDWMRSHVQQFASADSQLCRDPGLRAAFAFAFARVLWNIMPLPENGFRPEPIPEPGRNEPCPCGSGLKFKQCCQRAPAMGGITAEMLWPLVLQALDAPTRSAALASRHLPREALLQFAASELDAGHFKMVVELLEPQFTEPLRAEDDIAGALLNMLCNALDGGRGGKRRKLALLERISKLPKRSPLRSEAWQRLACIRMDENQPALAWQAFQRAQRDDPGNEMLGMLEVQLLLGDGRLVEARERARFHAAALRRRGGNVNPDLAEFYAQLSQDPFRAMADVSLRNDDAPGRRLAACIDRLEGRPLPHYQLVAQSASEPDTASTLADRLRQMEITEDQISDSVRKLEAQIATVAESPDPEEPPLDSHILKPPAQIAALYSAWRKVFRLDKPFSVQPLPFDDAGIWQPEAEARWSAFLEAHPEAFDSLDVLDDLTAAVALHPQADQLGVPERLAAPLLERAAAIIDKALAGAADARLLWIMAGNRPALRSLVRLLGLAYTRGDHKKALALGEQVLRLNPFDNHGMRHTLAEDYLGSGDADACLRIAAAFPDDPAPELRFNEALALFRLGRAKSAVDALKRAHKMSPKVAGFLLPGRVRKPQLSDMGVSLDGDDRAWLYRDAMREVWKRTPGALEWAQKVLGGGGK
jgi:tetratricopeptide (TPR) repeat protein